MTTCLSDEQIADWLDGRLSTENALELTSHVDGCAECRQLVVGVISGVDGLPLAPRSTYEAGQTVGRYVVIEPIGVGATGVVYAAQDPQLGRRVALKLLRSDGSERAGVETNLLLREAQALARLSHPNVVSLYEAFVVDERVVLAMELVAGLTLRQWLHAAPRSRDAVLDVLVQAGRGLAAAHAAGLVHRDVKPDNILVGDDGRVRVTDFGLARAPGDIAVTVGDAAARLETISKSGVLVGTPAYMPPEQLEGERLDARSDVFAFCVTAWEALFGARPFAGDDAAALRRAIADGPPAPGRLARRSLGRTLARGLAADRAARPATLEPILAEMARGPLWTAPRLAAAVALLACALVSAWLGVRVSALRRCGGARVAWGDVWSDEARRAARAALGNDALFGAIDRALGAYATSWIAAHESVCETHARGEISPAVLDHRMQCLDDQRRDVVALVRTLDDADATTRARVLDAVPRPAAVDRCTRALAVAAPLAAADRAARDDMAARIAEVQALSDTGHVEDCAARAQALEPKAAALADQTLYGRLLYIEGRCDEGAHGIPAGVATLHRAAIAAMRAHDGYVQAQAWLRIFRIFGFKLHDATSAALWQGYAEALVGMQDDDELRVELGRDVGWVALRLGHNEAARVELERTLAFAERRFGPSSDQAIVVAGELGGLMLDSGFPERAVSLMRRALAAEEQQLGPESPRVAGTLCNLVSALVSAGHADEAMALVPRLRAFVPLDPQRDRGSWIYHRIGAALRARGAFAQALEDDRRSVDACDDRPQHAAWVCQLSYIGVGSDLLALGRPREAVAPFERAVALTPDGPEEGDAHFGLARALWESGGDRARARKMALEARARVTAVHPRGPSFDARLQAIDRWLATHPAP